TEHTRFPIQIQSYCLVPAEQSTVLMLVLVVIVVGGPPNEGFLAILRLVLR
ncbi:hypothetical protein ACJMK2_009521, partial [Sinanodonta woodiana]